MRVSRKFTNLSAEPRVTMLMDNRSNQEIDLREAMATTATGAATVATGDELVRLREILLTRHPHLASFVASPGCVIVRVDVDTYHTITRFQNVYELHVNAGTEAAHGGAHSDPALR